VPINTHRDIVLRSAPRDMQRRDRSRGSLSRELHFRNAAVPPALSMSPFSGAGTLACTLFAPKIASSTPFTPIAIKRAG